MGRRRNISDSENRRARQREQDLAAVQQLLYTRRQTSRALGLSIASIQRMESRGLLDTVRFVRGGVVYHKVAQVCQLAEGSTSPAHEDVAARDPVELDERP